MTWGDQTGSQFSDDDIGLMMGRRNRESADYRRQFDEGWMDVLARNLVALAPLTPPAKRSLAEQWLGCTPSARPIPEWCF